MSNTWSRDSSIGCRVQRNGTSGELHSPGFNGDKGQYGEYQSCTYDVTVPPGQTVSAVFNYFDVHPSDVLRVRHWLVVVTRSNQGLLISQNLQKLSTTCVHHLNLEP